MKDTKKLYNLLNQDFETEKYYSFANRCEGIYQVSEKNGKRLFIYDTNKKCAYELVGSTGTFSHWNASAIEIAAILDYPKGLVMSIMSCKTKYYFGFENFRNGVTEVIWMVQPDGIYWADSDGYGMTDDNEIKLRAFIDADCHILVPFQEMDDDLRERYRKQAERIAANIDTVSYVCFQPSLTIPESENRNIADHRDVVEKVIYGMMFQMAALALEDKETRDQENYFAIMSAFNPSPEKHLDYVLMARESEEEQGKYAFHTITMLYQEGEEPIGCQTPFGILTPFDIEVVMNTEGNLKLFVDDFLESAEMIYFGSLPSQLQ